jgi:pilus assembly protein FimV
MMSSGKNPLVLMMALSMPGAANALGLGDIHVNSGLNEPLAAEIDLLGATPLELADLRAAVADRETFVHYGADRPAFLSSATFKVSQDSQGRPQLAIRSTESFTEPVVNFLVDLRWHNGEMIRQYTLLLDPPGLAAARTPAAANPAVAAPSGVAPSASAPSASAPAAPVAPDVPGIPAAAAPGAETQAQTVSRRIDPPRDQTDSDAQPVARKTTHVKVGAKATLRGIAWRVGERSESDLQRMMIAIFRANPTAFDGNINRLHRGAVLTIPSSAELASISKADAKREVHAQMAAWRSPARTVATSNAMGPAATTVAAPNAAPKAPNAAASPTATSSTVASPTAASSPTAATSTAAEQAPDGVADAALGPRIQSLEQELTEMKGLLESERTQLVRLQRQAASAVQAAPVEVAQEVAAPQEQPKSGASILVAVIACLGILGAAFAGLYFKFRRRVPTLRDSRIEGGMAAGETAAADGMAAFGAGVQDLALPAVQNNAQAGPQLDATADKPIDAPLAAQDDDQDLEDTQEAMVYVDDATHPLLPVLPATAAAGRSEIAAAASVNASTHEPTVNMHVDTVNLRADATRLDYNLLDLDLTAQHVQMPSVLNEHAVVKERRTNLADVLKLAIEREPDRHDLRMKLLELYYSAAATNRRAFLEVVQKLARDRGHLQSDQWDKIAYMGRQIAAENPLFAEETAADDDLADCA